MQDSLKPVYDYLSAQCARREYCVSDIKAKAVKRLEGNEQAALEVVNKLVEEGFLSDQRFSIAFARDKSSLGGWGPLKIRNALYMKGIPQKVIEAALAEIDPQKASSVLSRLLQNKWRTLKDDPQGKLKLIRFALSRGYQYDDIKKEIDSFL